MSVHACCVSAFLPADSDVPMLGVVRCRPGFKIRHVEVRECVVNEAMHGASLAEHVLVDESRDEV